MIHTNWDEEFRQKITHDFTIEELIEFIQSEINKAENLKVEEIIKMFNEYKAKFPDANWADAQGLLLGLKHKDL